jgi:uncharacterized lipoprotein
MKLVRTFSVLCIFACVAGCGGDNRTCNDPSPYKFAVEGKRVDVPDDLNNVEARNEMPLPEISPRQPRPEGSPCLDLPPEILSGGS